MANGKPISQWLKKNLANGGRCSTDSTITNSVSDLTPGSRSTVIDGLLSVDTASMFDENEQPRSLVTTHVDPSYNSFSPNQAVYDGRRKSSKGFDHDRSMTIKEHYDKPWSSSRNVAIPTFKKMRERQFGTKSSLKRLSRYKMRPSLFSAYANAEGRSSDSNQGRDVKGGTSKEQHGKHVRIGLFYTWSFSGTRQRKIVTVGENELGRNPKLDKLWEEAAKALKDSEEIKTENPKEISFNTNTNRLYETPEEVDEAKKQMNPQWTSTIRRQERPAIQPTTYDRYSDGSNRSLYRNIYPYTTMRHSNVSTNRRNYPAVHQYDIRTLPVSQRKLNRNDVNPKQNEAEKNIETIHKSFYGMMTGSKPIQTDYNGYYSNPMVPVNPMLIAPIPTQTQPLRLPVFESSPPDDADNRFNCSGRNCIFGWALGMTAVLILALAIALFIQINRDNNEFKNLQEKLASSANSESSYTSSYSNGGVASEIGLFHKNSK